MLKIAIAVLLLGVVASLFSGLFFLVRDDSGRKRTLHALALRITLSLLLVALLVWGIWHGDISLRPSPH